MTRWIAYLAAAALVACANVAPTPIAQDAVAEQADIQSTGLGGWNEAVITTASPNAWTSFLTEIAGWEVRHESPIDDGLKTLWDLPETATGEEILLGNIGAESGFIRLVHLDGVDQDWIRADARPWDTGGIFNMNVRVVGMEDVREKMLRAGWHGDSEPIQYGFGPFEVIEWIARGPDGVRLALIERLAPPLEGWPNLKSVSRAFNSTQTVADIEAASAFYKDVLGMQTYLEHNGASAEPGPNVLGLTHEDAVSVPRQIYILHPDGVNEGSVELVSFEGASGLDLTERALPKNIGLSVLRFPVEDLDATIAALTARGAVFEAEPLSMTLAPYGDIRIATLISPEGARLELYETVD